MVALYRWIDENSEGDIMITSQLVLDDATVSFITGIISF